MFFWGRRFPPKNEQKQVDLRYHSSKVEFIRSFFGGNWWPQKTISKLTDLYNSYLSIDLWISNTIWKTDWQKSQPSGNISILSFIFHLIFGSLYWIFLKIGMIYVVLKNYKDRREIFSKNYRSGFFHRITNLNL